MLDGEAHRVRKAMFVALLMREDGITSLVQRATAAWDDAVEQWTRRPQIVLFQESAQVLAGAVTRWAGVPVADDEVPALARDLQAMVDGFATGGPRHFRARRARGRREAWLSRLVRDVRSGVTAVPEDSAVAVVAGHRDAGGEQLPENRKRLADGDAAFVEAFAHEVRRFYPFAPFIGGRAPDELEWDGVRIPKNSMVLLDLYGQNHDPDLWGDPYAFRPERFLGRDIGEFELVPQAGATRGPTPGARASRSPSRCCPRSW